MKKEADTILYYAVKKHWHGGVFVRVYLSEKKKKKKPLRTTTHITK